MAIAKKRIFLKAEMLHSFFEGNEELDTLVLCKPENIELVTTDQSLYEALGSVDDKSSIRYNKMVKLLENTKILSYTDVTKNHRKILMPERVDEIKAASKNMRIKPIAEIFSEGSSTQAE